MTISFNGSGITLYSVMLNNLRFNVSIDGAPPTSYHFDEVLCCTSTNPPLFNYTLYSVTSLPIGYHTLLLTLLDSFSGNSGQMWLDYAFVDSPDNPKPTSDVRPSNIDSPAKSKSRSVIGPAIGGTIGGILLITIAILILFWNRRQTRRGDATLTDPDANILVSNFDRRPIVGGSSPIIDPDPNIEVDHVPIIGSSRHPSFNISPSIHTTWPNIIEPLPTSSFLNDPDIPHSSSTVPSTLPLPVSNPLPSANHISKVNDAIPTAPDPSTTSDGALAAQEARFLRHLYDRNAPAEEIAELMQAMQMRAREGGPAGMATVSSGHPDIAPPAYGSDSEVIR